MYGFAPLSPAPIPFHSSRIKSLFRQTKMYNCAGTHQEPASNPSYSERMRGTAHCTPNSLKTTLQSINLRSAPVWCSQDRLHGSVGSRTIKRGFPARAHDKPLPVAEGSPIVVVSARLESGQDDNFGADLGIELSSLGCAWTLAI